MSDGINRPGQLYRIEDDLIVPMVEQMRDDKGADTELGDQGKEILPNDRDSKKVRRFNLAAIAAVLDQTVYAWPGMTSFDLPDILKSIEVTFNKSEQEGESIHDAPFAEAYGDHGNIQAASSNSSQAGSSVVPGLPLTVESPRGRDIPCLVIWAYLPGPRITQSQVLNKAKSALSCSVASVAAGIVTTSTPHEFSIGQDFLFSNLVGEVALDPGAPYYVVSVPSETQIEYSTSFNGIPYLTGAATSGTVTPIINSWPTFLPRSHTFVLKGQQVSVQASASAGNDVRWDTESWGKSYYPVSGSRSDGKSKESGVSFSEKIINNVLHGEITLDSPTDTAIASATARGYAPAISGTGIPTVPQTDTGLITSSATANAGVTPTTLDATDPTDIPRRGLYLRGPEVSTFLAGYFRIVCEIVDFSRYA